MTNMTTDQATATLRAEGYTLADIETAMNSLSESGFEVQVQDDEDQTLTADEMSVLRAQLAEWATEAE